MRDSSWSSSTGLCKLHQSNFCVSAPFADVQQFDFQFMFSTCDNPRYIGCPLGGVDRSRFKGHDGVSK
jgi:hypothetical protein